MIGGLFMFALAFWALILYLFVGPWAAALWCATLLAFALWIWTQVRRVAIEEPEPLEPVDLEAELNCRGRVPADRYYDETERAA